MVDFKELIEVGIHFGHQKSRWCPKMAQYIWGYRNDIHLIDVSKTALNLEKAAHFLEKVAEQGQSILWIGTKKSSKEAILAQASRLNMSYVTHRWIGGTLSNFTQVKKSITKLLHYEDVIARASEFPHFTKKEMSVFQKLVDRLINNVGGIRNLTWPLGAIVIVDVRKERSALREAARMGIPVVALVDSNSDPSMVDYVIPGNDDAPRAVSLILRYLGDAVDRGLEIARERVREEQKRKDAEIQAATEKKIALEKKFANEKAKKGDKISQDKKVKLQVLPAKEKTQKGSKEPVELKEAVIAKKKKTALSGKKISTAKKIKPEKSTVKKVKKKTTAAKKTSTAPLKEK